MHLLSHPSVLIPFAVPGPSKRSSAVAKIVSALRSSILVQEDGSYLGSEDQLMARFGVSRPTLRQAVRLLEHERLLVIKRGGGGGFYGRRPKIEAVAHAAAIYLKIEHAAPRDFHAASVPLLIEASRLAASCRDEALRARLEALLQFPGEPAAAASKPIFESTLDTDKQFAQLVSEMSGNPVIKLYVSIIYEFGETQWRGTIEQRYVERAEQLNEARKRLIGAILVGDPELAALYCQRRAELYFDLLENIPSSTQPVEEKQL